MSSEKTMNDVLGIIEKYKIENMEFLYKNGFSANNLCLLLAELSEKLKCGMNNDLMRVYSIASAENGFLFGSVQRDYQKVELWLEFSEYSQLLYRSLKEEKEFSERLKKLIVLQKKSKKKVEIDRSEQAEIYSMAIEHRFLYKARNSNVFLENIGELVRCVNSDNELRKIKPYVYTAVLSRKHKMMTERNGYTPNIVNVFEPIEYKTLADNGKNFATYQEYVELYEQLRRRYYEVSDIGFTDYCFANLSNLSEWYYANCKADADIPMNLKQSVAFMSELVKKYNVKSPLYEFIKENPVLEIAYLNELEDTSQWSDYIDAVKQNSDISEFAYQLYKAAGADKITDEKEKAIQYAELCLEQLVDKINRETIINLVDCFKR